MKIFKSFRLTWWQTGIFKIGMLSLGFAIATTWPDELHSLRTPAWIVAIVAAAYITGVWYGQVKANGKP